MNSNIVFPSLRMPEPLETNRRSNVLEILLSNFADLLSYDFG